MNTENTGGHDTPLTPPSTAPGGPDAAQPAPPAQPAPFTTPVAPDAGQSSRSGIRPIGIILAVVGGIALVGAGATAAVAASSELSRSDSTSTTDADGIRGLDLDIDASDFTLAFGDVDQAELQVDGGRGGSWTFERDGDELVVHSPDRRFGWWFGGWFGGDGENVVLTLPEELRTAGLDADIDLDAGSLDVSGDFGDLDANVGAGALFLDGSASSVTADISAGRAEIDLADVSDADFTIAAGRLVAQLTGSAPDAISFDVSAGSLELTVPDVEYNVVDSVEAGSLDNGVQTASSAERTIEATVSAGSAQLRAED